MQAWGYFPCHLAILMKISPPWQGMYVNRVSQKSAQSAKEGEWALFCFHIEPRKSTNVIFTATLCPQGLTNEPPAPLNLSPDSTQHSEQHVTCVIKVLLAGHDHISYAHLLKAIL